MKSETATKSRYRLRVNPERVISTNEMVRILTGKTIQQLGEAIRKDTTGQYAWLLEDEEETPWQHYMR